MKIGAILDAIDVKSFALPEFQRGYVWSRNDVRQLMQSLYHQYPVGSLLVWQTPVATTKLRGGSDEAMPLVKLLLDGQQRITSLYGVMRGEAPPFFQGNAAAFTDLYFDLRTETFEFYGPVKMRDDRLWVSVTRVFRDGVQPWFDVLADRDPAERDEFLSRIVRLQQIRDIELHIEEIIGAGRSLDEVVDIFNRVNSGGTKLSKGDLALARICAEAPEARESLSGHLNRWKAEGYEFKLDWMMRVVNALVTGQASFSALRDLPASDFTAQIERAARIVDDLLNLIGSRLGFDRDRILPAPNAFPLMARFVADAGWPLSKSDQDRLLWWYVHSFLWGRYSASTETALQQDLELLREGGLDGVVGGMRRWRGSLRVSADDFDGSGRGSRFYALLYLLSRVYGARSFPSGMELRLSLLGRQSSLQLHHIFPKAVLQRAGRDRMERNALANFCFLTRDDNLAISDRLPEEYLTDVVDGFDQRSSLESQWIPTDPSMWTVDRYDDFLAARRQLLADAANRFLDSLYASEIEVVEPIVEPVPAGVEPLGVPEPEEPAGPFAQLITRLGQLGLAAPEIDFELVDESGELLALADAAWPDGLQSGRSEPIALLLEPEPELERRLGTLGYRFFIGEDALMGHLDTEYGSESEQEAEPDAATRSTVPADVLEVPTDVAASATQIKKFETFATSEYRDVATSLVRQVVAFLDLPADELGTTWGVTVYPSDRVVLRLNAGTRELIVVRADGTVRVPLLGSPSELPDLPSDAQLGDGFKGLDGSYVVRDIRAHDASSFVDDSAVQAQMGAVLDTCRRPLVNLKHHNPLTADLLSPDI